MYNGSKYMFKISIRLNNYYFLFFRIRRICDTDSECESDTHRNNQIFNMKGRMLSFSDDESEDSNTSEFDPGDNVLPKPTIKKGIAILHYLHNILCVYTYNIRISL